MREFEPLLKEYSLEGYSMYSKSVPESEWGNKKVAEAYLEKYWLPLAEYEQKWKPIQDSIFVNQETGLPKMVFAPGFEIIVARGGCLFAEEDFSRLQECLLALGEKFLLVVENAFGGKLKEPMFRMKYPADVQWRELTSGNFASAIMLEMPHKEYFVFGASPNWGKYSANDYEMPLDVIGFKRDSRNIFREKLRSSDAEQHDLLGSLPLVYRSEVAIGDLA